MKTQHTVLIVEDESSLRTVLADKLSKEGFSVLEANDGEQGLATSLHSHPDMILLDIVMPKMSGMEMLKQLREDDWGKKAKVILLTNLNEVQQVSEALTMGTFDYLIKSDWKIQDVITKIRERLGE